MSADQSDHNFVDAWIFIAMANPFPSIELPNPISNLIAVADTYNHDIPSAPQIQHGVRDLIGAGLIEPVGTSFRLTDEGRKRWKRIEPAYLMHLQFAQALRELRKMPCVADAPGWSLDQRTWEDAFAGYSAQFALELKRRREKAVE